MSGPDRPWWQISMMTSETARQHVRKVTIGKSLVILFGLLIAACQHSPPAATVRANDQWRVVERVGSMSVVSAKGRISIDLRPGDTIGHGSRLMTDPQAFLIIASEGVQLTIGEETALTLPSSAESSDLVVDDGWLRARLATAADRTMRIKTPWLDVDVSTAILTLEMDGQTIDLSIEDGNAALTTSDGLHRASLAAGAGARIEKASGPSLLVRQSAGAPFTAVQPIRSKAVREPSDTVMEARHSTPRSTPAPKSASDIPDSMIVPASHPKQQPGQPPAKATTMAESSHMVVKSKGLALPAGALQPLHAPPVKIDEPPGLNGKAPLGSTFDRLTDGLLDDLERAPRQPFQLSDH